MPSHAGDGSWSEGWGADGEYRAALPFEPMCNCPAGSLANTGELGLSIGYAQIWLGAVMADMWDQLIFAGGYYRWTAMAAKISARMQELRPSFRRPFGSPRPTVHVEVVTQASGCFAPTDAQAQALAGGPLRAAVWSEATGGNAICAHLVVVNAGLEAPAVFRANISGLSGPAAGLTATRLFEPGASPSLIGDGRSQLSLSEDWIGPGAVNIYRIGCSEHKQAATNLATPLFAAPEPIPLASATTVLPKLAWSVWPWSDDNPMSAAYDSRLSVMSDTSVAVSPARHSLRVNVPSAQPVVLALPGKQLVPDGPWGTNMHWKPSTPVRPGDRVVGTSVVLPGDSSWKVSILVQASPCGTSIALVSGAWRVTESTDRDMEVRCPFYDATALLVCSVASELICVWRWYQEDTRGVWEGEELSSVTPCGADWTRLEAELNVPPGNATRNGTALQLRLAVPQSERGWGGTVWVGSASVVAAGTGLQGNSQ